MRGFHPLSTISAHCGHLCDHPLTTKSENVPINGIVINHQLFRQKQILTKIYRFRFYKKDYLTDKKVILEKYHIKTWWQKYEFKIWQYKFLIMFSKVMVFKSALYRRWIKILSGPNETTFYVGVFSREIEAQPIGRLQNRKNSYVKSGFICTQDNFVSPSVWLLLFIFKNIYKDHVFEDTV